MAFVLSFSSSSLPFLVPQEGCMCFVIVAFPGNLRLYFSCLFVVDQTLSEKLLKHAYSNILKISSPKTESFQTKILIFFIFLLKT